jgi:conjugal transfer pilus assembly protein TraI
MKIAIDSTLLMPVKLHNAVMINKFVQYLWPRQVAEHALSRKNPVALEEDDTPHYPPVQQGLPVCSVQKLLGTQHELIMRIRHTLGLEIADFERLVMPVLKRYVNFVHLLPASEKHHHRGAGGLLRHGLEVAFWAAQSSEGVVFVAGGTPLERKEIEPRWHVAVCVAGLLHDIGKPVSDLSVVNKDGTSEWDPYCETIVEWATNNHVDRYFLHWHPNRLRRHEHFSLSVTEYVLTPEIKRWMSLPHRDIIDKMYAAIMSQDAENPIARLVKEADSYSVSQDLKDSPNVVDSGWGIPIEAHLMDAMRRLLAGGDWKLNQRGARVWVTQEGTFVVWKQAAEEIVYLLAQDQLKGIPRDPTSLAYILIERGYAIPFVGQDSVESPYWPVAPDMLRTVEDQPVVLSMLRITGAHILFNAEPPSITSVQIMDRSNQKPLVKSNDVEREAREAETTRTSTPIATEAAPNTTRESKTEWAEPENRTIHIGEAVITREERVSAPAETGHASAHTDTESAVSEKFLLSRGEAGKLLNDMAVDISQNKRNWGQSLARVGKRVIVLYPDGVRAYKDSATALNLLSNAGFLDLDPLAQNRKVREVEGVRGLVLLEEIAARVLSVAQCGGDTEDASAASAATEVDRVAILKTDAPKADMGQQGEIQNLLNLIRTRSDVMPYEANSYSEGHLTINNEIIKWYMEKYAVTMGYEEFLAQLQSLPDVQINKRLMHISLPK